jgi:hypothetical protein
MRGAPMVALAMAALVTAACSSGASDAVRIGSTAGPTTTTTLPPTTTTTAPATTTTTPASTTSARPLPDVVAEVGPAPAATVALLSAGASPLAPLRLTLTKGATATVLVRQDLVLTAESGGQTQSEPSHLQWVNQIDVVDAFNGRATVRYAYTKVVGGGVEGQALLDLVADELVDDRGQVLGVSSNARGLNDPTVDLIVQRILPARRDGAFVFPSEPIGLGGRWRQTRDETTKFGLPVLLDSDVTLGSTTASRVDMTWTGSFAKNPNGTFLVVPAGAAARMESVQGTTSGHMSIDLGQPGPTVEETIDLRVVFSYLEKGKRRTVHWTIAGKESQSAG